MTINSLRHKNIFLLFICKILLYLLVIKVINVEGLTILKVGDPCEDGAGECRLEENCPAMVSVPFAKISFCRRTRGIVCCPHQQNTTDDALPEELMSYTEKACRDYSNKTSVYCATGFITHGTKAALKEFPPAALLGLTEGPNGKVNWYCGGTLISDRFVLTAPHCFGDAPSDLNIVRLGELDYNNAADGARIQDFNISRIIVYPAYEFGAYYDIALVELERRVIFDEFVLPACLLTPKMTKYLGDSFTAVGWGQTEHGSLSSHLLKVKLDLFPPEMCAIEAPNQIDLQQGVKNRTQFCAGSHSGGYDTCRGDSGGPLFILHPHYKCMYLLAGVTSMGKPRCGDEKGLSVNINVTIFTTWIEGIVWRPADPNVDLMVEKN